jgi:hypothetical protein
LAYSITILALNNDFAEVRPAVNFRWTTYRTGGDIDDPTYSLLVALSLARLCKPVRLGGGPKPERRTWLDQHLGDVRT